MSERYISTKVITEERERLLGRPVGAADFAFICMEYQKGTPEIVSLYGREGSAYRDRHQQHAGGVPE